VYSVKKIGEIVKIFLPFSQLTANWNTELYERIGIGRNMNGYGPPSLSLGQLLPFVITHPKIKPILIILIRN
jgi:hypothetical protein